MMKLIPTCLYHRVSGHARSREPFVALRLLPPPHRQGSGRPLVRFRWLKSATVAFPDAKLLDKFVLCRFFVFVDVVVVAAKPRCDAIFAVSSRVRSVFRCCFAADAIDSVAGTNCTCLIPQASIYYKSI